MRKAQYIRLQLKLPERDSAVKTLLSAGPSTASRDSHLSDEIFNSFTF